MNRKVTTYFDPFTKRLRLLQTNLNLSKTLKLIWSVERKWTLYNAIMIMVETGALFFSLYTLKLLIDTVSHPKGALADNKDTILFYIFLAGVGSVFYFIARAVSAYVIEKQSALVAEHLDDKIHDSATKLDISFYESPGYFDILKRARDAGSDRPALVIKTLSEIVKNTLTFLAMATVLVTIDWQLIPIIFVLVLPILFVKISFADKLNMWRIRQTPLEREAGYLGGLITSEVAAKELRSYRLGNYFRSLYLKIRLDLLSQRLDISRKRTRQEIITTVAGTIGFFLCVGYIALQTLEGRNTIGDIALFLVVFPQSFNVLQNLSSGISIVYQNNIYINSIFDLLDLKSNLPEPGEAVAVHSNRPLLLEMKHVSFTYPYCKAPALEDINLKIPPGKIVGLVGLNGAGKTTLIKLLCRLYDVDEGQICLGGTDIRHIKTDDYRKQIGVVFQDFIKYNFSVKDNIRFGAIESSTDQERLQDAARHAGVHDFIQQLSSSYDSMMGRIFAEGHEASIGQWQKLAIARAFYSQAPVLIFDEATSALDASAEKWLFDNFRQSIGNRSALVISHRHSALKHADYIYVLREGKIVQSGTDETLLAEEGTYSALFGQRTSEETCYPHKRDTAGEMITNNLSSL